MNDRRTIEIVEIATKPAAPAAISAPAAELALNGYTFRWHGEAYDGPLKEWLVEGMLPKIGKALISGQWGTYKTFAAMDLAGAVMTKTTFAGKARKSPGRRPIHRRGRPRRSPRSNLKLLPTRRSQRLAASVRASSELI